MFLEIAIAVGIFVAGYKYGSYVQAKATAEVEKAKADVQALYDALRVKIRAKAAQVPAAIKAVAEFVTSDIKSAV